MHLPGARPADVPFLFEQQPRRLALSLAASLCFDIAAILLVVLVSRPGSRTVTDQRSVLDRQDDRIIWIAEEGPGGGGGGGGNQMKDPPRKAELPGKAEITVPAARPPRMEAPTEPPAPVEALDIPAGAQASAAEALQGLIAAQPRPLTPSQGPGSSGGTETGKGRGTGVRSLDPTFGLDSEAVNATRQWRFKPGTRLGQPVPVLVTIELSFALH
jgi:hypothetical protein